MGVRPVDDETLHIRYLILIAAVICALLIGYNAFYVPDASLSKVEVTTDFSSQVPAVSEVSGEEYTPMPVRSDAGSVPSESGPIESRADSGNSSRAGSSSACSKKSGGIPSIVNINTASAEQLETLSGIGDALAARIIAYRQQHGPFQSIDGIKNVSGIGDKKFEEIQKSISVG
jgi:competence protein ComEA